LMGASNRLLKGGFSSLQTKSYHEYSILSGFKRYHGDFRTGKT
jgi:hypothetical protein